MQNEQTTRAKLVSKLKEHYQVEKSIDLAKLLSATEKKIAGWNAKIATWPKEQKPLSHTEILNLVKDSVDAAVKRQREEIFKTLIDPITEYFPIDKGKPIGSKKNHYEIQLGGQEDERPDLRDRLERSKGIYILLRFERPRHLCGPNKKQHTLEGNTTRLQPRSGTTPKYISYRPQRPKNTEGPKREKSLV